MSEELEREATDDDHDDEFDDEKIYLHTNERDKFVLLINRRDEH
jgi:hypothetical protein